MPKRREFVGLSKRQFSTINTEINDEVYGKGNDDFAPLKERASDVSLFGVDEGEKIAFEMDRGERNMVRRKLNQRREQYSEMQQSGQKENIFGSVSRQKADAEIAQVGLVGGSKNAFEVGDFSVPEDDFEEATEFNQSRSPRSRGQDSGKRAPVTNDFDQWKSDPGHFDYPGVDTPSTDPEKRKSDIDKDLGGLLF